MEKTFVVWEGRRSDPLLDVRLFRNPRFSAASGAVALAFVDGLAAGSYVAAAACAIAAIAALAFLPAHARSAD